MNQTLKVLFLSLVIPAAAVVAIVGLERLKKASPDEDEIHPAEVPANPQLPPTAKPVPASTTDSVRRAG